MRLTWATRIQQTTTHFRASTRGYGSTGEPGVTSPTIAWAVGGVTVPAGSAQGSIDVPTPDGTFAVQDDLTADPAVLVPIGRGGERSSATVRATATEPDGSFGHDGEAAFDPVGWTEGFSREDNDTLTECLKKMIGRVHLREQDWLIPVPPEDPGWGRRAERINVGRIEELARRVGDAQPGVAEGLASIAQLRWEQLGGG